MARKPLSPPKRRKATSSKGSTRKKSAKRKSRSIPQGIERELWVRAGGRCQFNGCNHPLYKSSTTQESVNVAEKAHIYSFSQDGPRGWADDPTFPGRVNSISNLLLVCHDCHKTIDKDKKGIKYSATLLSNWKARHERRIEIVTGIDPSMASHVVLYGASIGAEQSVVQWDLAAKALFPIRYPADQRPTILSMQWQTKDSTPKYWSGEATNLADRFAQKIIPLIEEADPAHFSLFGLGPMPLLMLLGGLFTDKVAVDVYQLHREPPNWDWLEDSIAWGLQIVSPERTDLPPVLVVSISAKIDASRIRRACGRDMSIWELRVDDPGNDVLRSRDQLLDFRRTARTLIARIEDVHGNQTPLRVFPAMPVACAVELGRVRMPKANAPWIVFDQQPNGNFVEALTIGREHG